MLACFLPFASDIVSGGGTRRGIVGHCNFGVLCVWFLAGLDVSFRVCESSAPLSESRRSGAIGLRPVFGRKLAWRSYILLGRKRWRVVVRGIGTVSFVVSSVSFPFPLPFLC